MASLEVAGVGCEGAHCKQKGSRDGAGWLGGLVGEGVDGEEDGELLAEVAGT